MLTSIRHRLRHRSSNMQTRTAPEEMPIPAKSGKTLSIPLRQDPHFTFSVFVPESGSTATAESPMKLLVLVHGIKRRWEPYLDLFSSFAERHRCVILCPLFPGPPASPKKGEPDISYYQRISDAGIRFDRVLLDEIEQAAELWPLETRKFWLHGFSAGGQFAHRFFYLHPERLYGVSVGAPGRITAPPTHVQGAKWIDQICGGVSTPDPSSMKNVKVQLVVGENDMGTGMLRGFKDPTDAENEAGLTRVGRTRWLHKAFTDMAVEAELEIIPGTGHDGFKCVLALEGWLDRQFALKRSSSALA